MKLAIWVIILVHHIHGKGIAFISGNSAEVHMHDFRQQERRLAADSDHNYKRGYISIDCGNDEPDSVYGINYTSDLAYIDTGSNHQISSEFASSLSDFYFKTVRSFPDGVRNCYTFRPLNGKGNTYLIRAHFMYGNYDLKNKLPIFDIYIGVNFWRKVELDHENTESFYEMIHKATTDSINICLVNINRGTPFISALSLRPLNNSIYDSNLGSLDLGARDNTGWFGNGDSSFAESYADDVYDRFWGSLPHSFANNWEKYNTSTDVTSITNDAYKVPPSIFQTGAQPLTGVGSLNYYYLTMDTQPVFNVYWHFAETKKLGANESREFQIFLNGSLVAGPIRPKYLQALTIASSPITLGPQELRFHFSINQTNSSTLPPFLNALEIYEVKPLPQSATNQDDVNAIMDIKNKYGPMSGWQGDPCLPVSPWDGLNCSDNGYNSPRITSLNLTSRGLTGELLPSISSLTSLTYLNLSNNNLTGMIPEFLANMPSLQVIDLRGNKFNGSVPVKLMDKVKNGLLFLSLDDNQDLCIPNSCTKKSKKHKILAPSAASASLLFVLLIIIAVFCVYRWKRKQGFTEKGKKSEGGIKSEKRQFTYSEVINMTQNFQITLGKGAFGTVYRGSLEDGSVVAVKILNQSSALSLMSFRTEAELLMRVHHRKLVSLIGYCDEGTTMALIYEFMANGNLQEQLSGAQAKNLSWKKRLQISIDAAQGLEYLHSGCKPAIVHRDMKTANNLLDDKFQAKIADFGMSRIFATESASHISTDHVAGTPGYLDPECHVLFRLNEKSDVYSFGIILLELITGQMAMNKSDTGIIHIVDRITPFIERGDIHNIVDKRLHEDYGTNSAWRALETAMACVPSTGHERPNMAQVLADLKECFTLQLAYEKTIEGVDQKATNSSSNNFDSIYVDSEAIMSPIAR